MIKYENLKEINKPFLNDFELVMRNTIESGKFIYGPHVDSFEKNYSKYIGVKYGVGVNSGTDALILSLASLKLEPGSEVIVPSNTYIAAINAILHNGLIPILVEPDIQTYNIDPLKIEDKITSKTKVILVVHMYGLPANMDSIMYLANKYKLRVIEDCSHAHGASINGKKVGSFDIGAFSFYPTKNLGALGDSGMIVTNDEDVQKRVRELGNYGSNKKYSFDTIGINSRLDDIQAGFLNIKLQHLDKMNLIRQKYALMYQKGLNDKFIKPIECENVYHVFPIRFEYRDDLQNFLSKNGIETFIHYPIPPHKQISMRNVFHKSYPISEDIHKTILSLPISTCHTENDIEHVIKIMNQF